MNIKLGPDASTATVRFVNLGEQVFDLTTDGEHYFGSKQLDLEVLDGRIIDAQITINRINGQTYAGFTVTESPKDGGRWGFSGFCERASANF
ncbi:hypothetical protein [Janthinobacterium sp. 61]|uniref:hypothetical protein n=1 Tax=Janthinobacterium sp. 61 TaxID=2035209 RepID=UPI00117BD5F2|nr:hypothetical protein [Janthinobacterium sp. 61]